jgi:hypothetical protein
LKKYPKVITDLKDEFKTKLKLIMKFRKKIIIFGLNNVFGINLDENHWECFSVEMI